MARPRLHDDALASKLLDHAASMVSSGGVRALSLRSVAAAAGTSTAAVYSLFGGKDGLLAALYARVFSRLGASQGAVGISADPLEDIVRLGLAYRAVAVADPHGYRVIFGDEAVNAGTETMGQAGATAFDPLLAAVRRAVDAGLFPPEPGAPAIATALWGNVHGLVSLELGAFMPPQAGEAGAVFEAAVRATVAGWAASV